MTSPRDVEQYATDRGQQEVFPLFIGVAISLIVGITITDSLLSDIASTEPATPTPPLELPITWLLVIFGFVALSAMLFSSHVAGNTPSQPDRLEELKTQYVDGELSQLEYENRVHDHWEEELEEVH